MTAEFKIHLEFCNNSVLNREKKKKKEKVGAGRSHRQKVIKDWEFCFFRRIKKLFIRQTRECSRKREKARAPPKWVENE